MQGYVAVGALAAVAALVAVRSSQLKRLGIRAFHFGRMDKKDFLIPPCLLFYVYQLAANTFGWPRVGTVFAGNAAWVGAAVCAAAPLLFLWGILSFGRSFRVGIDMEGAGSLVTTGAFAVSRNPLYVAFLMIFLGVFLIFPTWIFFLYFTAGLWLIDRQVCLEENALRKLYGAAYDAYCERVRRYL